MQNVELNENSISSETTPRQEKDVAGQTFSSKKQLSRKVTLEKLINRINYLNFKAIPLTIILSHRHNGRTLRLEATPEACTDNNFTCKWDFPLPDSVKNGEFDILFLEVPQSHHILHVKAVNPQMTENGLRCKLPETAHQLTSRRIRRHPCSDIGVSVIQNGATFTGSLGDMNAAAFRLELTANPPQTFQWIDNNEPMTAIFSYEGKNLFTTQGKILRRFGDRNKNTIILSPTKGQQHRFRPKKHRNRRLKLKPAPEAVFTHPLTNQLIRLDVSDISGAGISVIEAQQEAQLLPGMIIECLELRFADSFSLSCHAQVVYCEDLDDSNELSPRRSGLAILDMDVSDHTRLLALLHRAEDRNKGVCPKIDIDQLWEFFFDSGFIYPQKYKSIQEQSEGFKETYSKLYDSAPEIARHFIYQKNNRIVGHMAMLRQHTNTWLIHHHAADNKHSNLGGMETLQLAGETVNEAQALCSSHMDYVMCYYRPENKFPKRIFGNVAKHYDNPELCSVDTFAYFHYSKDFDLKWQDKSSWELAPARAEDFLDIEAFYHSQSGGLMLKALDLTTGKVEDSSLADSYKEAGFQRERTLFVLRKSGRSIAFFVLLRTEVGLNLSNLTNAITAIVIDSQALPREAFFTAISMLASKYPQQEVPVLTYPSSYATNQSINIEKLYNMWVLDCQHLDPYFEFLSKYFKRLNRSKKAAES